MNIRKIASAALVISLIAASTSAQTKDPGGKKDTRIDMRMDDNVIRLSGGTPGDTCAILVGVEQTSFRLPGGAEMKMAPLAILAMGKFDESGDYSWSVPANHNPNTTAQQLKVQALSVDESGHFRASDLYEVDYHGNGEFSGRQIAMAAPRHNPQSVVATRRALLA